MTHKVEPLTARLFKGVSGAIVKIPFRYRTIKNREFILSTSVLPGNEFIQVSEEIYTSNTKLNFAKGDKVELADKRILTIKDIKPETKQNYYLGIVTIGYTIVF